MILHPETFDDGGCWISDDRIYAFVSATHHCVTEIGFHGPQPVSRNSRVFVGHPAALRFSAGDRTGGSWPIFFEAFDWYAGGARVDGRCGAHPLVLELAACGHALLISVSAQDLHPGVFRVTVSRNALFTDVHGDRTWAPGMESAGRWETSFRDLILLNKWLNRTGPYAGDFLLPEPLRRRIFLRNVRSGLATAGDLRPEFRDAPIPAYDAEVPVSIGGPGYTIASDEETVSFSAPLIPGTVDFPPFEVRFLTAGRSREAIPQRDAMAEKREMYRLSFQRAPAVARSGFPRFEEYFSTVPPLVESCIIRDHGIPRATPGRYYWIWAWDAMVTALAAHRWGSAATAQSTLEFIDAHRDGDAIPMQWTRALEPLDTQPRGALEALLTSLAHTSEMETGSHEFTRKLYPRLVDHLRNVLASADPHGLFPNIGFYPDLPRQFGRTGSSAVALEVGCFYTFCRTIEDLAHRAGDRRTAETALATAALLEQEFLKAFWDGDEGFLCDAIDLGTGERNRKHPLFSLLFLHSSLGWALVRRMVAPLADFIARRLMTDGGMRVLPRGESSAETVSNAWYPHWDLYALKVLRRAGRGKEILRWLADAEQALGRLGFCPEYISYKAGTHFPGSEHGAPSNLNCVTGWYQAFLEGVVGLESDPGGLTIIPLPLPIGDCRLRGITYRATRWNVTVCNGGNNLQSISVDRTDLRGSLKIPVRYADGGEHSLILNYGDKEQPLLFREVVNAEVLDARVENNTVDLVVRALGRCDVIYSSPEGSRLTIDGKPVVAVHRLPEGTFGANLAIVGEHILRLTAGSLS